MASVAYSRTSVQIKAAQIIIFIAENPMCFSFFGNGGSHEGPETTRLISAWKLQRVSSRYWDVGIGPTAAGGHVPLHIIAIKMFLLPHGL